ncbi:MAG: response regulator, partial [Prolixibacteraceae bacterium]|nr:response regulator [Prolixibacteraceae bacterium]
KKGAIKFGYNIIDKKILFYIEDSGIGIPSEQQEKIFERFRQVEMEASRVFGGAGLGLSISKKMVELLNGKIWLKSELGVGSTFYVTIPFSATNPESITSEPTIKKPTNTIVENEQTILIAEDDESNFFYLNELLIDYNYKILRAKNGAEAVELFTKNKSIVMVFMDIKMPIMDGFEATKKIKKINPSIPIIAQTAFAMADDRDTAIENGCDDYISKPIDPEILYRKIKKYASN